MTRLQALVVLLEGWLDYHPWPNGSSAFAVASGPAPSVLVACGECDGRGKLAGGWRCERCGGRGRLSVDGYTGDPVADAETSMREILDTWVACSSCAGGDRGCSRCHGSGREAALIGGKVRAELGGVARSRSGDAVVDALADGLERRQASVTGRELEAGMRRLRVVDPAGHTLLVWVLVLGRVPVRSLGEAERIVLLSGLVRLSRLVVGPLVVPGELVWADRARRVADAGRVGAGRRLSGSAQARRDAAIRELYGLGSWSMEALGVRFGVNKATVSRAVGRELSGDRVVV